MSSFFSALKDKAQSAVSSGGFGRPGDAESASGSPGQPSSGVGGFIKSHGLEGFTHQLRTLQQNYSSSTTPVQKIITTGKGIAIDYDNVSRDAQAHSKELYLWGQTEAEDIKDVTDRLGWLSFVHGSLAGTLATKINKSRSAFKFLRDAENALAPRRNIRVGLENQIARIEHDQRKDQQAKLAELKAQLRKNEEEDETAEKDIELLKRRAIRETEQEKWEAIREYAEKLSMVAQAALAIIPAQGPIPPTNTRPYTGATTTASVRASLQHALDGYTPGNISLIVASPTSSDLKHTRSFGETHAKELSKIGTADPLASNIPTTPPPSSAAAPPPAPSDNSALLHSPPTAAVPISPTAPVKPSPLHVPSSPSATATSPANVSPPLNPANLNQAPAPIPVHPASTSPIVAPDPSDPALKVPTVTPTVAETGVPKVAGPDGPGPSSGSLLNNRTSSPPTASPIASLPPPRFESAEDEKKRLEREDRERLLHQGGPTNPFESAEEEKKRLEREERERVLHGQGGSNAGQQPPKDDDAELPPYQEF